MAHIRNWPLALGLVGLLTGCTNTPFNKVALREVDRSITHTQAVTDANNVRNRHVVFGGNIIATRNLPDHSEIVVLAYPLNNVDRPDTSAAPLGRFIVIEPGYLEGANYAPQRLLSVHGYLDGVRQEPLGESLYNYPIIRPYELHLWPAEPEGGVFPRFHIGVGVSNSNVGGSVGMPIP